MSGRRTARSRRAAGQRRLAASRGPSAFRLADYLPYRLSVAAHAVSSLIAESQAREFGLPMPQWRLLAIVHEHGALTQQQLVPLSTMDKQMVSRAARALQQRGLLRRVANRADRRTRLLRLSARGQALFTRVAPRALEHEAGLLSGAPSGSARRMTRALLELQRRAEQLRDGARNQT